MGRKATRLQSLTNLQPSSFAQSLNTTPIVIALASPCQLCRLRRFMSEEFIFRNCVFGGSVTGVSFMWSRTVITIVLFFIGLSHQHQHHQHHRQNLRHQHHHHHYHHRHAISITNTGINIMIVVLEAFSSSHHRLSAALPLSLSVPGITATAQCTA